ncbi:MAG TPA: 30S ribosomal protein S8 [Candidatus Macondimonas sp.]|jgi:small subunit ribosomal protein S8|nr:30S ribosomal protein S8 [Candidatus Macondimonas sp.]
MSMTDPIADMLTRIRNAQRAGKAQVSMPLSRSKQAIARLLLEEGYVANMQVIEEGVKSTLSLELKYFDGRPVIEHLERISRPGLRIYRRTDELPSVLGGLGVAIVSTSKGLMTDRTARAQGMGGEVVCTVY